jgi:type II secretory pathway component GspD/PulD (secretin)
VIDRGNNIDTKVEVGSSFVAGEGPGGAPKIKSTTLQSAVYVKSGNSIALGGLIGQRELRSTSGSPPGGGSALVQLNKSRKFQHGQSEVLLFVTPTILRRNQDAIRDMGRKVKKSFKNYERENIHRKPVGE